MPAAAHATNPPTLMVAQECAMAQSHSSHLDVGQPLTDEGREDAIKRAGRALEAHYFRWCCTGNFADKGDADRARLLMEKLIAGRSPEMVRRLEIKRGLI